MHIGHVMYNMYYVIQAVRLFKCYWKLILPFYSNKKIPIYYVYFVQCDLHHWHICKMC